MADETEVPVDDFDLPLSSSEGESAPSSEPAGGTAPTGDPGDPAAAPASPPPNPLAEQLRAEGLREVAGETAEQTYQRLARHLKGKGDRFYAEMQSAKAEQAAHARGLAELRQVIEPLAREHFARQKAEQTAALAAEIPDKVADPMGYQIWLQEQILIRDEEARQAEAVRAQQEREQAESAATFAELQQIDGAGFDALAFGLGKAPGSTPDPELVRDYGILTNIAYKAVAAKWPNSTEEERLEFLENAQQLDVRDWVLAGVDPRQGVKDRVRELREMLGVAAVPANGNGHGAAAAPASVPAAAAPPKTVSPTATQMQAEAAAAARRAPVTASVTARPAPATSGPFPDASSFEDSDEYVEAVLDGLLGSELQRVGSLMKER
jgi:hypothetical protein